MLFRLIVTVLILFVNGFECSSTVSRMSNVPPTSKITKSNTATRTSQVRSFQELPPGYVISKIKSKGKPRQNGIYKHTSGPVRTKSRSVVSEYQCKNDNNQHIMQECIKHFDQSAIFHPTNHSLFHVYKPVLDQDVKYFKESRGDDHRDARFYLKNINHITNVDARNAALTELFVEWSHFTQERNLTFWIAHGLLIGYYWSNDLLPWDQDLDVQVTAHDLLNAYSQYHNTKYKGRYLLDVNPHSKYRLYQLDNVIDARFVDTSNGYYLDVTGVSYNPKHGVFQCKSVHSYRYNALFPLRSGLFCGERVWVPRDVEGILIKEYGAKCLVNPVYRARIDHREEVFKFDHNLHAWIRGGGRL